MCMITPPINVFKQKRQKQFIYYQSDISELKAGSLGMFSEWIREHAAEVAYDTVYSYTGLPAYEQTKQALVVKRN